ncbi:unnamed protein product [Closterium sp. Yama58-4]|nr:unnamed protein product [Closterium sp. Yama58-4]
MDSHESYDPSRVPAWLPRLLRGRYFTSCPRHAGASRAERNYFCVTCSGESLCTACIAEQHSNNSSHNSGHHNHSGGGSVHSGGESTKPHNILQIRRSSYHECVRINELTKILDLSHIQVYVINSAKIVFLNGRPQARPVKGAPFYCETCERMLLDASRFCSLGCKLAAVPKDSTLSFVPRVAPASGGNGAGCNGANASKRASATGPATSHRVNGYNAAAAGGNSDTWKEDNGNGSASAAWVQKARTTGKKLVTPEVNTATSSPEVSLLAASMEYDNTEDSFGGADSGGILVADDDDDRLLVERDVDGDGDGQCDGSFVWSQRGFGGGKRVRVEKYPHTTNFPQLVPISSPFSYPDGSPSSPPRLGFSPPSTPSLTSNRRRKGVPQRSPLSDVLATLGLPIRVFTYGAATPATPATPAPFESDAAATAGDGEREGGPATAEGGSQAVDAGREAGDDFYEFTPADYSRLMAGKKEERFLKTKAIRDLEQQQRKAQFKQAIIRVRFPDNTVVEAAFVPTDAVASVRQLVRKCLLQPDLPFFFYTTPPKRRIKNEEEDLYSAQLTPGALLHVAVESSAAAESSLDSSAQASLLHPEILALKDLPLQPELSAVESSEGPLEKKDERGKREVKQEGVAAGSAGAVPGASKAGLSSKPKWFKR